MYSFSIKYWTESTFSSPPQCGSHMEEQNRVVFLSTWCWEKQIQSKEVAPTTHDGFCFHCSAVNTRRRPRLSQGLKTCYWFYCCCTMQPGKWQISGGAGEWRPSTWPHVFVANGPKEEAGGDQSECPLGSEGHMLWPWAGARLDFTLSATNDLKRVFSPFYSRFIWLLQT